MGHRKKHAPRRGSMGYSPRKKARRHTAWWRNWPSYNISEPKLLGFAGYKAGMTHAAMNESKKTSNKYKQEKIVAITVIETPPISIWGIRLYGEEQSHITTLGEVWSTDLEPRLNKRITLPNTVEDEPNGKEKLEKLKEKLDEAVEIRVLAHTNPKNAGTPRKPQIYWK